MLVLGWFFLLPTEYKDLGRQIRDSLLFISNHYFLGASGYFDPQAQQKRLLHTWSLSVEWQFYLFLPVVLSAVWALFKSSKALVWVVIALAISSLLYSVALVQGYPEKAFYILPSRAWELLAGAAVAACASRLVLTDFQAKFVEILGLGCIVGSLVLFKHEQLWPGAWALLPVSGAALVIAAQRQQSLWTANPVAQWLGTRSYSIYLWHWPVVVALAYLNVLTNGYWQLAGLGLTLLLGALSYRYVEVVSQQGLAKRSRLVVTATLLGVLLILLGMSKALRSIDISKRLPSEAIETINVKYDKNPRKEECLDGFAKCQYGSGAPRIVVVGDSHADSVVTAIEASLQGQGSIVFRGSPGCPILFGYQTQKNSLKKCQALNEHLMDDLAALPKTVPVLVAGYTQQYVAGGTLGAKVDGFYLKQPIATIDQAFLEDFSDAYVSTMCQIAKDREVYLLRHIPIMPVDVPTYLGRFTILGRQQPEIYLTLEQYAQQTHFVRTLQDRTVKACGVKTLEVTPYLCMHGRCPANNQGEVWYRDTNHLSEVGNRRLIPLFKTLWDNE